jgi:hypothetical protein
MLNACGTSRPVLRLDPWMPDYEGAIQIDPADEGISGQVDTSVETAAWEAVAVPTTVTLPSLYFIDGVRRTEARVLAWDKSNLVHGLFGAVAAGAVCSDNRQARFDRCAVQRVLLLGGGHSHSETIQAGSYDLIFTGIATVGTTPAEVTGELQELMRQLEAKIAEDVLRNNDGLVFIDGPLAYITSLGPAIGVIKRISLPYIDAAHFVLVTTLALGERTPLFLIADGKRDRYSWYLRIGQRRDFDHELTGIVRLEVRATAGLETARHQAAMSAPVLVEFASLAVRDPRAPQNLVPIGALEQELRRRMGDPLLIRRGIEKRISERIEL